MNLIPSLLVWCLAAYCRIKSQSSPCWPWKSHLWLHNTPTLNHGHYVIFHSLLNAHCHAFSHAILGAWFLFVSTCSSLNIQFRDQWNLFCSPTISLLYNQSPFFYLPFVPSASHQTPIRTLHCMYCFLVSFVLLPYELTEQRNSVGIILYSHIQHSASYTACTLYMINKENKCVPSLWSSYQDDKTELERNKKCKHLH